MEIISKLQKEIFKLDTLYDFVIRFSDLGFVYRKEGLREYYDEILDIAKYLDPLDDLKDISRELLEKDLRMPRDLEWYEENAKFRVEKRYSFLSPNVLPSYNEQDVRNLLVAKYLLEENKERKEIYSFLLPRERKAKFEIHYKDGKYTNLRKLTKEYWRERNEPITEIEVVMSPGVMEKIKKIFPYQEINEMPLPYTKGSMYVLRVPYKELILNYDLLLKKLKG